MGKADNVDYFDTNGTAPMCDKAAKVQQKMTKSFNASSTSKIAETARNALEVSTTEILEHCRVSNETHQCIFTSGGTEGNVTFIQMVVNAAWEKSGFDEKRTPHVVASSIEHKSILSCLENLAALKRCTYTLVPPHLHGIILVDNVVSAIKPETCLVTVMGGNNENGAINDIYAIHSECKSRGIPMHSDMVPLFPRLRVNLNPEIRSEPTEINDFDAPVEAITISGHKFGGPKGIGALIIHRGFKRAAGLRPILSGSQQEGMRGGTENTQGIASMAAALKDTFTRRASKNKLLRDQIRCIVAQFKKAGFPVIDYREYIAKTGYDVELGEDPPRAASLDAVSDGISDAFEDSVDVDDIERPFMVVYGPPKNKMKWRLPNTLQLAIVTEDKFCNVDLKKYLDNNGIVVGISSACLTSSKEASHVVKSLLVSPEMRRGTIRISLADDNTKSSCKNLVSGILKGIEKQIKSRGKK